MTDDELPVATGTATANQLSKLFKVDKNRIAGLLEGIAPVGKRKAYPIYNVREAAGRLVEVSYDVEERIRRMNPADLPPLLLKDFWNGLNARTKHERESGNLWPTADVEAMVAALLHVVAINQKLMLDNVERQAGMTVQQRAVIKRISEGTVNATREAINERFAEWSPPVEEAEAA